MSQVLKQITLVSSMPDALRETTGSKQRPVRVLHIITRLIVGGAQENTLLSVEGLGKMTEYDVVLMTGIDKGREGELLSRARHTTKLLGVPELGRAINPLCDLMAFVKV